MRYIIVHEGQVIGDAYLSGPEEAVQWKGENPGVLFVIFDPAADDLGPVE
jgi:hypothetical protein